MGEMFDYKGAAKGNVGVMHKLTRLLGTRATLTVIDIK